MLLASAGSDRSSSLHLSTSALSTGTGSKVSSHAGGAVRLGPPPRVSSRGTLLWQGDRRPQPRTGPRCRSLTPTAPIPHAERTAASAGASSTSAVAAMGVVPTGGAPSPSSPLRHAAAAEMVNDTHPQRGRGRTASGDASLGSPPLLAPTPPATAPPEGDQDDDANTGRYTEALFGDTDAAEVLEDSTLAAGAAAGRPFTAATVTQESCSLPSSRYDDF